jgi:hypothetical protein
MAVLLATSWEAGIESYYSQAGYTIVGVPNIVTTSRTHGAGSTYALDVRSNQDVATPVISTSARWVHAYITPADSGAPQTYVWTFVRSGGATFWVRIGAAGAVSLLRGTLYFAATVLATSGSAIDPAVPHWIAVKLDAQTVGGVAEVWVDGALVVSFSGDTQGAGSSGWDQVYFASNGFGQAGLTPDYTMDDLIIVDDTTGRLAEQLCLGVRRPSSVYAGNLTGVPVTGSGRWQNVDEAPADQSDYNEASASGEQDGYDLTSLTVAGGSILCVVVWTEAERSGSLTQIEASVQSGGTLAYGPPETIAASGWSSHDLILETDPDTGLAWTPAAADSATLRAGARFT